MGNDSKRLRKRRVSAYVGDGRREDDEEQEEQQKEEAEEEDRRGREGGGEPEREVVRRKERRDGEREERRKNTVRRRERGVNRGPTRRKHRTRTRRAAIMRRMAITTTKTRKRKTGAEATRGPGVWVGGETCVNLTLVPELDAAVRQPDNLVETGSKVEGGYLHFSPPSLCQSGEKKTYSYHCACRERGNLKGYRSRLHWGSRSAECP